MTKDNPNNLPVAIDFSSKSLFDPIIEEFSQEEGITLYDVVMNNIDPAEFEKLKTKKNMSVAGLNFFDGGKFEKVSIAGRGSSSEDVITKRISTAGSANFSGRLAVAEKASFAGKFTVKGDALFKGKVSLAGSGVFQQNVVNSGKLSIAGKLTVNDFILADGEVRVAGTLSTEGFRSTNKLKLGGKIWVGSDLIARNIELDGMSGTVAGNLYAEEIKDVYTKSDSNDRDLSNLVGVLKYVAFTLRDVLTGKRHRGLTVQGDVIADKINMNNMNIQGNIYGKEVSIGPDTEVYGTIYYIDSLSLPAGREEEFTVKQGFPETIGKKDEDLINES